ncbi:glycosyltransferase family 2 protein [Flavobacterium jejuense]|uniref:Glycosyltransferase family 2 protein n=1 Tax=Flavobacterium jejuense TaxID=1544455 RepID=A0ABX0ISI2_9FLAO|nr:glycosyltransferase family A protein [Flavobacterium jejuense]NHN26176.1 glycosyltransferase family 2 protein [Flavobacterium jejuense]
MIFNYLKYLKPIWYFNLKSQKDFCYFPTEDQLKQTGLYLEKDKAYKSEIAQVHDLSWEAFQSGFISDVDKNGVAIWKKNKFPTEDEFRFLRKNFHKAWVLYVLLIRLFSFHNPFKEIMGFLKTSTVKRVDYSKNILNNSAYEGFESSLVASEPFISVVIPTLNRYKYLKDVLKDLEKQTYKNFEVLVVDQTDNYKPEFYDNWNLNLKYWFQEEKALWKARNEAIQAAKGDYILLYDDDSLVEKDWIYEHLKCLDFYKADLSSGVSISTVGAEVPKHYSYFRWSDQLDTGNVLLKKEIFNTIGLFDLQFEKQRMGDGEYGLRCYLKGYKNISNYKAKRIHLKVSQGGLRQMGSWDGWRPKKLFGPRPVPSVLYLSRKYFGAKLSVLYVLHSILPSLVPYQLKKSKILKLISFLLLPFFIPLVGWQIIKSWNLASAMLNKSCND